MARYSEATGILGYELWVRSGIVTTDLGTSWNGTGAVAVESDGKILVAGGYGGHFAILRYTSTGSLDSKFWHRREWPPSTFGGTEEMASALAIDGYGNILVGGTTSRTWYMSTSNEFGLARYNADGTPDDSFGTDGVVTTRVSTNAQANAIALQSSNRSRVAHSMKPR